MAKACSEYRTWIILGGEKGMPVFSGQELFSQDEAFNICNSSSCQAKKIMNMRANKYRFCFVKMLSFFLSRKNSKCVSYFVFVHNKHL